MTKLKLYIDIDGVLLGKRDPNEYEICLAGGTAEFLEFALTHFDCYWLTSRANQGYTDSAIAALRPYADRATLALAKLVKPTAWSTLKTEAIDFKGRFFWLDDQLFPSEEEVLEKHGCFDRWIKVDTRANYSDLVRARQHLAQIIERI